MKVVIRKLPQKIATPPAEPVRTGFIPGTDIPAASVPESPSFLLSGDGWRLWYNEHIGCRMTFGKWGARCIRPRLHGHNFCDGDSCLSEIMDAEIQAELDANQARLMAEIPSRPVKVAKRIVVRLK